MILVVYSVNHIKINFVNVNFSTDEYLYGVFSNCFSLIASGCDNNLNLSVVIQIFSMLIFI